MVIILVLSTHAMNFLYPDLVHPSALNSRKLSGSVSSWSMICLIPTLLLECFEVVDLSIKVLEINAYREAFYYHYAVHFFRLYGCKCSNYMLWREVLGMISM